MRIYLAGPMRGIRAYNHPAFDLAAAKLRARGHTVFSPAEEDRRKWPERDWINFTGNPEEDGLTPTDLRLAIMTDIAWITREADMIAFLPGWLKSKGARLEKALGDFLGDIIYQYLE